MGFVNEGSEVAIGVCVTCRREGGPDDERPGVPFLLALQEAAAGTAIAVRPVQCFGICKRPCTVALSGAGRYTYLFGDLEPETGVPALMETASTYAAVPHGYMLWRERPEALRRTTIARVPPLGWIEPDGRHPR